MGMFSNLNLTMSIILTKNLAVVGKVISNQIMRVHLSAWNAGKSLFKYARFNFMITFTATTTLGFATLRCVTNVLIYKSIWIFTSVSTWLMMRGRKKLSGFCSRINAIDLLRTVSRHRIWVRMPSVPYTFPPHRTQHLYYLRAVSV